MRHFNSYELKRKFRNISGFLAALFKLIGGILAFVIVVCGAIISSTLGGVLIGWLVGLIPFFNEPIQNFFSQVGIVGLKTWQLGLVLGFIGGFFKTSVTKTKSE